MYNIVLFIYLYLNTDWFSHYDHHQNAIHNLDKMKKHLVQFSKA